MDGLDDFSGRDASHLGLRDTLLRLSEWHEDAQAVELNTDTHCQQLRQTGREHTQDCNDVLQSVLRTVRNHVLCETAGGQRLLTCYLGIKLAITNRVGVGILLQIDTQNGCIY